MKNVAVKKDASLLLMQGEDALNKCLQKMLYL